MAEPSDAELLERCAARIAEIERLHKAAAVRAGEKTESVRQMRLKLQQLQAEREAKIAELREAEELEAAEAAEAAGAAASTSTDGAAAASSSSAEPLPSRVARVLLGVSMPHFLSARAVRELVHAVHEKLSEMADVRIVCMADVTTAEGMDATIDEVVTHSRRAARLAQNFAETQSFSTSDGKQNPYRAASEL